VEPSHSECEFAIANLKKYNAPGIGRILAEFIQAGGEILHSGIYKSINK
jgi:hypothetical protein